MKQPIQPLIRDSQGSLRFKENAIVSYLLDACENSRKVDLNDLARIPFSQEDREQFAQLIGYSLSGASELSYFSSQVIEAAERMHLGSTESDARIEYLEAQIQNLKDGIRGPIAELFRIHPDDLQ